MQGKDPLTAEMLNLGIGGALLCVRGNLKGAYFYIELPLGKKRYKVKAHIAHTVGRDPNEWELYYYGMQFESDLSNDHVIRRLIDNIRGGRQAAELKRDYWNL